MQSLLMCHRTDTILSRGQVGPAFQVNLRQSSAAGLLSDTYYRPDQSRAGDTHAAAQAALWLVLLGI